MQEIPKLGLDSGQGKKLEEKKAKEKRSHVTMSELRHRPDGKLERSLETKAETGSQHQVKFK